MTKQKGSTILTVRIPDTLLADVDQRVDKLKVSRNSWLIKRISDGLRNHRKQ